MSFETITKNVIFALLGILILTVAVPVIYLSVATYLPNWSVAGMFPLGSLIQTIVPLVLGIAILMAVITGLLAMIKWGKKR
jgi:hypothetical protein